MPGAPSSFLLLVVRPGAPSSVLAPKVGAGDSLYSLRHRLFRGRSLRKDFYMTVTYVSHSVVPQQSRTQQSGALNLESLNTKEMFWWRGELPLRSAHTIHLVPRFIMVYSNTTDMLARSRHSASIHGSPHRSAGRLSGHSARKPVSLREGFGWSTHISS